MERSGVVVLGSINIDTTLSVPELPGAGETVLATGVQRQPGGKGLNQAVAAARHGAPTAMIACVGSDADGDELREMLGREGVDAARVRTVDLPTGSATVMVDSHGENTIVVAPQANHALTDLTEQDDATLARHAVLLCQLEIPMPTVVAALASAHAAGVVTVLNAAPATTLPPELAGTVDVLIVNAGEARIVGDALPGDDATSLLALAATVIVTRGGDGADVVDRDGRLEHVTAPSVHVVDTTGAGDAFCGAFCAAVASGRTTVDAVRGAVLAGARTVQHEGAIAGSAGAAN